MNLYTYCANNPVIYIDPTGHRFWPTKEEWATLRNDTQAFLLGVDEATTGGALVKLGQNIRKFFGVDYITDEEITQLYEYDDTFRDSYEIGEFMGLLGGLITMSGGMNNNSQPSLVTTDGYVIDAVELDLSWIFFSNNGNDEMLRPEAGYLKGKKHGLKWKEGPARAKNTGKPQGQWGSLNDLMYAAKKAATLKSGEGGWFNLPEGSNSIVYNPDGTTVKATRIWVRNNGTGTFHGYPAR